MGREFLKTCRITSQHCILCLLGPCGLSSVCSLHRVWSILDQSQRLLLLWWEGQYPCFCSKFPYPFATGVSFSGGLSTEKTKWGVKKIFLSFRWAPQVFPSFSLIVFSLGFQILVGLVCILPTGWPMDHVYANYSEKWMKTQICSRITEEPTTIHQHRRDAGCVHTPYSPAPITRSEPVWFPCAFCGSFMGWELVWTKLRGRREPSVSRKARSHAAYMGHTLDTTAACFFHLNIKSPLVAQRLKICHCHCYGLHHCCAVGFTPGPRTSSCSGCSQNNNSNKTPKTSRVIHHTDLLKSQHLFRSPAQNSQEHSYGWYSSRVTERVYLFARAPITKWHRLGGWNNRNVFPHN